MKKLDYAKQVNEQIISHEVNMLKIYQDKAQEYSLLFKDYGCTLKLGLMWGNFPRKTTSFNREKIKNGYNCYVYCVVQKNGRDVSIKSTDEEADYYCLSTTWMVSSVCRNFFKLMVSLYTDTNDVYEDLEYLLLKLRSGVIL